MKYFLGFLLVLFLALALVGFFVKALLWLAGVGIVLFALTVTYWVVRGKMHQRDSEAAKA